jgi:predicted ABC-class ATPase
VGLPAAGRRILGPAAAHLLLERLPRIAERALHAARLDLEQARLHVETVENHAHLQGALAGAGLIAFVADGAILPRESGASDRPLDAARALPFRSPGSLRVELPLLHPVPGPDGPQRTLHGMGVPAGVTLIVGGGYHGKSTLLRALERGVHPHVPGDGREYVVAAPDLVKIRAEDGRSVVGVDIHGFIDRLPAAPGRPDAPDRTRRFSTSDASGSTSQAAAIVEAIEAGAHGLLLDEDTSATNFMLRDARMQRLVHAGDEPITPFIDRVRELYDAFGVSTVLVMGGSGDYFDVADTVVRMRAYAPEDATAEARAIARDTPTGRVAEHPDPMGPVTPRVPLAAAFDASRGRRDVKISARDHDTVLYGEQTLDLRHVTQLVDPSQTRAAALAIHLASRRFMAGSHARGDAPVTLAEVLDALDALIDAEGLDVLDPFRRAGQGDRHPGNLARPRRYEIAATLNRMRTLQLAPDDD